MAGDRLFSPRASHWSVSEHRPKETFPSPGVQTRVGEILRPPFCTDRGERPGRLLEPPDGPGGPVPWSRVDHPRLVLGPRTRFGSQLLGGIGVW